MCADFTASYIGGEPQSAIQPSRPIQDESNLTTLGIFNDVASTIGSFGEQFAKERKAQQAAELEQANNQVLTDFSREQLKIIDAVETGEIRSSSEGRMRMRANLSRFLADNPSLQEDIVKAHGAITKVKGLGEAVYEGTEEEKQQQLLETEALKAGFVKPTDSETQKQLGTNAYFTMKRNNTILENQTAQLNYKKAQISLTTAGINQRSAKLSLAEQQAKINTQNAIGGSADAYMVKLHGELEDIRQAKEDGKVTTEQAMMMADQAYFKVSQFVNQAGAKAGGDYLNSITKPMQMQYENYKKYLSGETKLSALQSDSDIAVALQTKNITGNPQMATIIATSKLFPNSDLTLLGPVNEAVTNIISKGGGSGKKPVDIMPDYDEDKTNINAYFGVLTGVMGKINDGSAKDKEDTKVEVNNNLNNVLLGIDVYGPTSKPGDYKSVIDFLSDTNLGRYVSTQGGWTDSDAAHKASQVLEYQYDTTLIPLIQKEWEKAQTGGTLTNVQVGRNTLPKIEGKKPVSDLITPQFTGSGVSFVVNPGETNGYVRQKARELNNTVAPILNKMIRTQAHLNGSTDYKSVWQNTYEEKVFGKKDVDENAQQ